jgi:hypothetical protein
LESTNPTPTRKIRRIFRQNGIRLIDIFLIPAAAWEKPTEVFVDRDYNKDGQTSQSEYGINISQKNYGALECFKFQDGIKSLM